jgi:hypothetical protein
MLHYIVHTNTGVRRNHTAAVVDKGVHSDKAAAANNADDWDTAVVVNEQAGWDMADSEMLVSQRDMEAVGHDQEFQE